MFARQPDEREFEEKVSLFAGALAWLGNREELAGQVREQVNGNINAMNIGEELGSYRSFADAIESDLDQASLRDLLRRRLTGIRESRARASSRTALVPATISSARSACTACPTRPSSLCRTSRRTAGGFTLAKFAGTLWVRNNRLIRLAVSGRMVAEKMNDVSGRSGKVVPVYGRSFVTDNVFFAIADNLLVAERLAMTANAFGDINVDEGNVVLETLVANTASFVGNHGPFSAASTQLQVAALSQQAAANIELTLLTQ